jgi:hypothetical protein
MVPVHSIVHIGSVEFKARRIATPVLHEYKHSIGGHEDSTDPREAA